MSRRRYIFTQGGQPIRDENGNPTHIEVTDDWSDTPRQPIRVDVSYMDGLATTDGKDISSKRKRREYMHVNNLADPSDFTNTWAKAAKERDAYRRGETKNPATREALGRAAYQLAQKRRR